MHTASFLLLADALPEVLVLLSSSGDVIVANQAGVTQLGLPGEGSKPAHLSNFIANTPEQLEQMLKLCRRTRKPLPVPIRWCKKAASEGKWRCEGFLLKPVNGDDQVYIVLRCILGRAPASEFLSLNRELNKQQSMLQKLQDSRAELEKEHEKAVVTLSSIGDAVITTDTEGVIEYQNPIAEQLTGWSNAEAIGHPLTEVFNIINELTRKPVLDPVMRCLQHGQIVGLANHTILLSKDGAEHVIEDSAAPIRTTHDGILGAVLVFRDVTDDRLARRQLEYLAQHDTLTGLKNRYFFEQELKQAVQVAGRGRIQHALLYIDMDQFKVVNDTAGHGAGDELLVELAQIFSRRVRQGDILARLGGDEFGVMLDDVTPKQASEIAASYIKTLSGFRFSWEGKNYDITPSIGIAILDNNTVSTAEAMRQADIACYVSKQAGGNRYHMYNEDDELALSSVGELNLVHDIREALLANRFTLYFQPIIKLTDGSVQMHEVLLRMLDKQGEIVNPATFIPIAERYGLMPAVDRWVVAKVFDLINENNDRGRNLCLTINLSGASIGDPELMTLIKDSFIEQDLPTGAVIFEVTETAAVGHIEKAGEFIRELREVGCYFALDDFGTGFSSFAYLKHMPVDYVKIDGTFVKDIVVDPVDQAMVRSINQIAHSLGKETIAEFVEDEDILDKLRSFGVNYAQGYHIGRPGPTI